MQNTCALLRTSVVVVTGWALAKMNVENSDANGMPLNGVTTMVYAAVGIAATISIGSTSDCLHPIVETLCYVGFEDSLATSASLASRCTNLESKSTNFEDWWHLPMTVMILSCELDSMLVLFLIFLYTESRTLDPITSYFDSMATVR